MSDPKKSKLGGVASVAEMMNLLDPETRQRLMKNVAERDPGLAGEIEQLMLTFEQLAELDDASIQLLLKESPNTTLILALREAPEEIKAALFRNLSERAARILKDEIEISPPQKRSAVRKAQNQIVETAKKLLYQGKIRFK